MKAIYIPGLLKAPERTEVIQIDEFLPELETLTPVRGQMKVSHQGNYLDVSVKVETIVTLTCHRCLQQYNHRLAVNTSEMIWLDEAAEQPDTGPVERETPLEDLLEMLPPQGNFQPDLWLYEQMCLAIPPRQLCDKDCSGIQPANINGSDSLSDRRWQALEALKKQFPK